MHEPGAVLGGHEVGRQHRVAALAVGRAGDEVKRRLVAHALQLGPREGREDVGAVGKHAGQQGLGDDHHGVAVDGRAHVGQVRVHGDRGVGDERPRGGRPYHELLAGIDRRVALHDRQAHVHRRIDHVAVDVGLAELVAGQRGLVAGAVGDDLEALVEQALLVDGLQRPPHRLDVRGIERAIGVVEIDPEADPLGQPVPLLDVAEDLLPAAGVELGDPVALDVVLAGEAELGLHGQLNRETVAVPAALALDVMTLHRLEAGEDVLERPREHVVRAGGAVGRRGALIEPPARAAATKLQRLSEDVALAPAFEDPLFESGKVGAGIDGTQGGSHGTRDSSVGTRSPPGPTQVRVRGLRGERRPVR